MNFDKANELILEIKAVAKNDHESLDLTARTGHIIGFKYSLHNSKFEEAKSNLEKLRNFSQSDPNEFHYYECLYFEKTNQNKTVMTHIPILRTRTS